MTIFLILAPYGAFAFLMMVTSAAVSLLRQLPFALPSSFSTSHAAAR